MTTENQYELIAKFKKWKGADDVDMEQVRNLSNEEASALIDNLKVRKSVKQVSTTSQAPKRVVPAPQPTTTEEPISEVTVTARGEFNPIQMGMVKKFVAQDRGAPWVATNKHEFADLCLEVYVAFNLADERAKKEFPSSD